MLIPSLVITYEEAYRSEREVQTEDNKDGISDMEAELQGEVRGYEFSHSGREKNEGKHD